MLSLPSFIPAAPLPALYSLSLHDALPISASGRLGPLTGSVPPGTVLVVRSADDAARESFLALVAGRLEPRDRKSTRLNSSHVATPYAVFCLNKKTALQKTRILCYSDMSLT